MTNVGTIRCAMGGQLTLRCTLWSSNLLEMWQFASIRDDFLRSLYRLYRCVWYRCVWMPFFLVTSSYAICTWVWHTLTDASWHFTESVLQTCFFLWSTPSKSALFHKLHPVTRGTCYCQYKMLCCLLGVALFFLVALVKMWQTCGPLALGLTIDSSQFLWLCKAHMKELQEFNQHWDQKAGSSTSRWWEFIRMHKDFLVYVESNVQSEVVRIKDWGVYKQIFWCSILRHGFLIASKY